MKIRVKYNPSYSEAYSNLGGVFLRKSLYRDAIEMFKKAIFYKPEYATPYYHLGKCYEITNNIELAMEYYKKAHELQPSKVR